MAKKATRVRREMTPEEKQRWEANVRAAEQDKEELLESGRELKGRHEAVVGRVLQFLTNIKEAEGLSLTDLDNRTGIDRSSLSRLFNTGSNPTLLTLNKIAEAMGHELRISIVKKKPVFRRAPIKRKVTKKANPKK